MSCWSGWRSFSGPLVRMRRSGPVNVGSNAARLISPMADAMVEDTSAAAIVSSVSLLTVGSSQVRRTYCHDRGGHQSSSLLLREVHTNAVSLKGGEGGLDTLGILGSTMAATFPRILNPSERAA